MSTATEASLGQGCARVDTAFPSLNGFLPGDTYCSEPSAIRWNQGLMLIPGTVNIAVSLDELCHSQKCHKSLSYSDFWLAPASFKLFPLGLNMGCQQ